MGWFWKTVFRLSGWRLRDVYPKGIEKAVLIVAPHTSSWDFPLGLAARGFLDLKHTHYLGKEELFKGPFGWLFRATGGYPINRFNKEKMVDQVVTLFQNHDQFILALSPEGTRKKVDRLRTGFYHIAKKQGFPSSWWVLISPKRRSVLPHPFLLVQTKLPILKRSFNSLLH